jgi:hypothetical protein
LIPLQEKDIPTSARGVYIVAMQYEYGNDVFYSLHFERRKKGRGGGWGAAY